eukprot:TRINITY_DN42947_c0_g1_i1.p1 TRINITY_DN42947_c0_g1~~TRINITY_DN42947_c0_g1_i1.p1  ORF type:complete len:384 (+),score=31.84 TRINITY_DN42947_c0_g1_i1:109-1152(+)
MSLWHVCRRVVKPAGHFTAVMGQCRSPGLRALSRSFASASRPDEPRDLYAAWASLAAYDSAAAGNRLRKEAEKAKAKLRGEGFELVKDFTVDGGKALSFDGSFEVHETDAAYLWLRSSDGRGMLAFRGSDTQQDLKHVRDPTTCFLYGHHLHAGVAQGEFEPLVSLMSPADFSAFETFVVTGHSLGGGCACMFSVLMNDAKDPLNFGSSRKFVDELYGFGATPVFHDTNSITPNQRECELNQHATESRGWFKGAIYRALRTVDGEEVQDAAFTLATKGFHYPKTHLVSLRAEDVSPVANMSSKVKGVPAWREHLRETPLDKTLFPLHSPVNYVKWLGKQKKRLSPLV